jgi:nitronate monooxygenase
MEANMDGIQRRSLMKGAAIGGLAFSVCGGASVLTARHARAQGATPGATVWPNRGLLDRLKLTHPIIQAPMGGAVSADMVMAVCGAGGLGSFPGTPLTPARLREDVAKIRTRTDKPINLNFFCHPTPQRDEASEAAWRKRLAPYYAELGLDPNAAAPAVIRSFDADMCEAVIELRPEVVSFHFGLPDAPLIKRIKAAGSLVISSATTVAEARWLEEHGADAIIAQGAEAGGHRGMFLATEVASQVGTLALVPQVVDAVKVPVIAAGGIADGRGIAAVFALGASAVQMGTAYLFCPEARISAPHRAALKAVHDDSTVLTNVVTGRPYRAIVNRIVREVGPLAPRIPSFPLPLAATMPLRTKAESQGSGDFSALYAGQAAALGQELPAGELTLKLATEALDRLGRLGRAS